MAKGYQVAILTNTIPSHFIKIKQLLIEAFPQLSEKHIFASFELESRKEGRNKKGKQPDIFQIVLDRLGIKAENAIFLDDNPNYVAQAQDDGITSLQVRSDVANLKERLFSRLAIKRNDGNVDLDKLQRMTKSQQKISIFG